MRDDLPNEVLEQIEKVVMQYPNPRSAIVPLLHILQKELGYISQGAMDFAAELLEMSLLEIKGIVSYYPIFRTHPAGHYVIKVCQTISCELNESHRVAEILARKLGCPGIGGVSEDGFYSVEFCECLACCDKGPNVMINNSVFHGITPDKLDEFVEFVRNEFPFKE